jgi:Fic family protein
MQILDPSIIEIESKYLHEIDERVKRIFRAITFCRKTSSKSLLDAFVNTTNSLTEILSIKNAQMEATSKEELVTYHKNLNKVILFVVNEIKNQTAFENQVQLFQIFRLVSPESHSKHPNQYRNQLVQIGGFLCPEPKELSGLITQVFQNLKTISNPLIRAIYLHHELIRIHPFIDGNGRTVRIAKNWMLMYNLYPPIFIKDEIEKSEYIASLSNSFKAVEKDPSVWHPETLEFFMQELRRMTYSTNYILNKVTKNSN